MMSKRNSSGGGQSSLGYLFGSNESGQQQNDQSKVSSPSPPVLLPPYGTDNVEMKSPEKAPTSVPTKKDGTTSPKKYIYHGDGVKKDFLVTGRPSTKVKSVPGGDSSLGYLFGDK